MTIQTNFPFTNCESCEECILRVNTEVLYADDQIMTRVLNVSCENAKLCMRLEKMKDAKKTESDNGN